MHKHLMVRFILLTRRVSSDTHCTVSPVLHTVWPASSMPTCWAHCRQHHVLAYPASHISPLAICSWHIPYNPNIFQVVNHSNHRLKYITTYVHHLANNSDRSGMVWYISTTTHNHNHYIFVYVCALSSMVTVTVIVQLLWLNYHMLRWHFPIK